MQSSITALTVGCSIQILIRVHAQAYARQPALSTVHCPLRHKHNVYALGLVCSSASSTLDYRNAFLTYN